MDSSSPGVNETLSALRSNYARHLRNVSRKKIDSTASGFTFNDPSLPLSSISTAAPTSRAAPNARIRSRTAGFIAPPSWIPRVQSRATFSTIPLSDDQEYPLPRNIVQTPQGRIEALLPAWTASKRTIPSPPDTRVGSAIPSLLDMSAKLILDSDLSLAWAFLILPPHLLCFLVRYALVASPERLFVDLELPAAENEEELGNMGPLDLVNLFGRSAGVEGEVNFDGGPRGFHPMRRFLEAYTEAVKQDDYVESWEDPIKLSAVDTSRDLLDSIYAVNIPLVPLINNIRLFPATLTHLALIAISLPKDTQLAMQTSIQPAWNRLMRRLSKQLPSLEFIDLSLNSWFDVDEQIRNVEWHTEWRALRRLILRGALLKSRRLDPSSHPNTVVGQCRSRVTDARGLLGHDIVIEM